MPPPPPPPLTDEYLARRIMRAEIGRCLKCGCTADVHEPNYDGWELGACRSCAPGACGKYELPGCRRCRHAFHHHLYEGRCAMGCHCPGYEMPPVPAVEPPLEQATAQRAQQK